MILTSNKEKEKEEEENTKTLKMPIETLIFAMKGAKVLYPQRKIKTYAETTRTALNLLIEITDNDLIKKAERLANALYPDKVNGLVKVIKIALEDLIERALSIPILSEISPESQRRVLETLSHSEKADLYSKLFWKAMVFYNLQSDEEELINEIQKLLKLLKENPPSEMQLSIESKIIKTPTNIRRGD